MQIQVRGLALFCLLVLGCAAISSASAADLSVQLSMDCPLNLNICNVSPYQGTPGSSAAGLANFNAIDLPWSFSFVTANPLSWNCEAHCEVYNATFGAGGTFLMNGPGGTTFIGEVTSGTAWQDVDISWGASLSFSGKWSNGLTATGDLIDQVTGWNGPYASLDVYTVPEPASLALLGGGIVVVWGALRRKPFRH
jgi:hypothetical protein